ncbi:MAG: hypothetical protein C5B58_07220 [Acidobacteria bacterium]|nr:MAG: hypothetical protein C5B58_07220 [Acidobacteriota bacterium]
MENDRGAQATLFTTLSAPTPTAAYVVGTKGTLRLDTPFYEPPRITVTSLDRSNQAWREFEARTPVEGLCFEAAECGHRIANGFTESPYLPLQESVEVMETLDAIRAEIMPPS